MKYGHYLGYIIMKTPSMKKLTLAAAIASITSVSLAGPIAPVVDPIAGAVAGTPLSMLTDQLSSLDAQLEALSAGDLPGLDALPVDPAALAGGGLPGLDALPVDPASLPGGGLPSLDALPIDPTSLGGGGGGANPLAGYVTQLTFAADELAVDLGSDDSTVDAVTDVVDTLVLDPAMLPDSIQVVPATLVTALTDLQANLMALSGAGGDSSSLPFDPAALAGGDLPGLDALPVDPASLTGGDGGGAPSLDALPIDPTALADGGLPGLDTLPIDPASLTGGDGGGAPTLDALPIDPASLADGGLPGLDALPIDPASLAGGDGGGAPSLDALPIDPASLADGGLPGLDALPIDPASLAGGGGGNPLAGYVTQLTFTVDQFADDISGRDGLFDTVTDVVDVLVTDPAAAQASIEAILPTIETTAANLQANLMALSGGDSPL
ncbi:MAG: hypothetical protein ACI8RU_001310 [Zhongshania aliphaticivorans]|jgi:hypothetical protein